MVAVVAEVESLVGKAKADGANPYVVSVPVVVNASALMKKR